MSDDTKNANNAPEFRCYVEETQEDGTKKLVEAGAAWLHKKGGGMNVTMKDGNRMVLFPAKKQ